MTGMSPLVISELLIAWRWWRLSRGAGDAG